MRDSRRFHTVVHAHRRGYRVTTTGEVRAPSGRLRTLQQVRDRTPYYFFTVRDPQTNVTRPVPVHMLAAVQLFGAADVARAEVVRHLDGDCHNNALDNIALGTHSQNAFDRPVAARKAHAAKAADVTRTWTTTQVQNLRARHAAGTTATTLCREFGCALSTVSAMLRGITYADVLAQENPT